MKMVIALLCTIQLLESNIKKGIEMKRVSIVGLGLIVSCVSLMGLDIETYYKLDIKAMKMTLDGSKERLACLKKHCPLSEQYAIDDRVQQEILELYKSFNTTPSKHIGFYSQNIKDAKAYYDKNETLQEQYSQLTEEIEEVNSEIKALMEEDR